MDVKTYSSTDIVNMRDHCIQSIEQVEVYPAMQERALAVMDEVKFVTHADHRALEEELYAARLQRDQAEDKLARATEELASLRARVGELVEASTAARRELQSCQAVIHLHGGFDPAYVEGAQKAMSDLSSALEGFV